MPIHLIPCPPGPLPAPNKNEQRTQKSQAELSPAPSLLGPSREAATHRPVSAPAFRKCWGLRLRARPMCFGCLRLPGTEWPSGGALREAGGGRERCILCEHLCPGEKLNALEQSSGFFFVFFL